jgi:aminoglycoside phosphotransferase (APT) family kinase protein
VNTASDAAIASLRDPLNRAVASSGHRVLDVLAVGLVHERPGRRRTYRVDVRIRVPDGGTEEQTWYAKAYATSKGARSFRKLVAIACAARYGVRVPEPLGYSEKDRLVVTKAVPHPCLETLLGGSRAESAAVLERLGDALTGLHEIGTVPESVFGTHGPGDERVVLANARKRADAAPFDAALRHRFHVTQEHTMGLVPDLPPASRRLLHRDLHPGQILLLDDTIVLLDTDEAAFGEPELDVGNLAAHLRMSALRASAGADRGTGWVEALESGYRRRADLRADRLAAYTASTLLRLASLDRVADARVSRLDWPRLAEVLIEEASRALSG